MIGAKALTHEVRVVLRSPRPHERISAPPGYRAIVAVAATLTGAETAIWHVPRRDRNLALDPKCRTFTRMLEQGVTPPGWILGEVL